MKAPPDNWRPWMAATAVARQRIETGPGRSGGLLFVLAVVALIAVGMASQVWK